MAKTSPAANAKGRFESKYFTVTFQWILQASYGVLEGLGCFTHFVSSTITQTVSMGVQKAEQIDSVKAV